MKTLEFLQNRSKSLSVNQIEFSDTSEPSGFNILDPQLQDCMPYQFEISSNEYGRVHGFMLENIFHIVWFDPDHNLYPKKK